MVEIEYKGANSVVISTKKSKLVTDPKVSTAGLKDVSIKGAIEVATEARFAIRDADAHLVIDGPGEYEVMDFSLRGVAASRHIDEDSAPKQSAVYRIVVEDVAIALLGNISPKLDDEQLEALGIVDVLILPVGGGGYTLDATSAAAIARSIEAKVVIPIHYADAGVAYEVAQDTLETFLNEFNAEREEADSYKIKNAASIPQVVTTIHLKRG